MNVNRLSDNSTLRSVTRKCWPKEQHTTKGAAEAQRRSILRRGLAKDPDRIRAYKCESCPFWHVGHGGV